MYKKVVEGKIINNDRNRMFEPEYLVLRINPNTKINKMLYNIEVKIKLNKRNIKVLQKWMKTDIDWKEIFITPITCTIDTKLREFQYKYIMRIVPNNVFLFKCKLVPSNLCDFCSMATETVKHMFWECYIIQKFWVELHRYLNIKGIQTRPLTFQMISFGTFEIEPETRKRNVINYLMILAKYYIFKSKCNKLLPSFVNFVPFLQQKIDVEKIIATQKNKLGIFNNKWSEFLSK